MVGSIAILPCSRICKSSPIGLWSYRLPKQFSGISPISRAPFAHPHVSIDPSAPAGVQSVATQWEPEALTDNKKPGVLRTRHRVFMGFWQRPTLAQPIAALPSALRRFTSVFGMGTGGTTALRPPDHRTPESGCAGRLDARRCCFQERTPEEPGPGDFQFLDICIRPTPSDFSPINIIE